VSGFATQVEVEILASPIVVLNALPLAVHKVGFKCVKPVRAILARATSEVRD